jgi:hypothetical protein
MTEANFQRSLQAFVSRQPFHPFSVEFSSGDRFTVDHPEALALRGRVAVFIHPTGITRCWTAPKSPNSLKPLKTADAVGVAELSRTIFSLFCVDFKSDT